MLHWNEECLPIYANYDLVSVYIEKVDLRKYRLPLKCYDGFYFSLYVEKRTSHLDIWSCN